MNDALMHMGMITATVKQYVSTALWVDMLEDTYNSVTFIDENDTVIDGLKNWMNHLLDEGFCHIYIVAEPKEGGFNYEGFANGIKERGIVVVLKKKISLWMRHADFDEDTKKWNITFKEFPYFATETRPLLSILKEKPDFVYCEGTFMADNQKAHLWLTIIRTIFLN